MTIDNNDYAGYAHEIAQIRKQYHEQWVVGGERKIKTRTSQITRYNKRLTEIKQSINDLIEGKFDHQFKRPSEKDTALERYIDSLNNYLYLIDRAERELVVLNKHLTTRGSDGSEDQ